MMESLYKILSDLGYHHPLHPTQINMPVGLVVGAFIVSIFALKKSGAAVSVKHLILLAFLFIFPTVATGFMDWLQFYGGAWVYPFGIKVMLGSLLFLILLTALLLSLSKKAIPGVLMGLCALAFVNAVALGYFGGEVVFGQRAPVVPNHKAGEIVFRYNCSGCHPFGGNHIAPAHPVIGAHVLASPEALIAWIRSPEDPMPPFPPEDIPDQSARRMADYLSSLWGEKGEEHGHAEGDHAGEKEHESHGEVEN